MGPWTSTGVLKQCTHRQPATHVHAAWHWAQGAHKPWCARADATHGNVVTRCCLHSATMGNEFRAQRAAWDINRVRQWACSAVSRLCTHQNSCVFSQYDARHAGSETRGALGPTSIATAPQPPVRAHRHGQNTHMHTHTLDAHTTRGHTYARLVPSKGPSNGI